MQNLRAFITYIAVGGLAIGYFFSQYAFFTGRAPEYASAIDRPVIKWLALILLVVSIAFSVVKEKNKEKEDPS